MNNVLIVSLRPRLPVRSGFQNTINLLTAELESKFNVVFTHIDNPNDIDPVYGLKYDESFSQKLDKLIKDCSPKFLFVNTSKLLYQYREILFKRNIPIILVCHDLYHFRKEYFKKNRLIDSSSVSKAQELGIIKDCRLIIDFANYEHEYLRENNINESKLFFTMSPVEVRDFNYNQDREFDFFFIGSNWQQNTISLNHFFEKFNDYFGNKKVKIIGTPLNLNNPNFSFSKVLNKRDFLESKIGIAPIYEGTGRNVKIFDMMANGLPVVTNRDLSNYGLQSGYQYIHIKNINDWDNELLKLEQCYELRKSIAYNGWKWADKNCGRAFEPLLKELENLM